MPDDIFITYTHPDQLTNRSNRRRVAQYIGTHHRNRSKPTSRRLAKERARWNFITCPTFSERHQGQASSDSQDEGSNVLLLVPVQPVSHDHSGIRVDPFTAFPISHSDAIAPAVDYCKTSLLEMLLLTSTGADIRFYAPAHLVRPEIVPAGTGARLVRQHFQYAIQHPLMFEATIALAHASSSISHWTDQSGDRLTLYHYGQAISRLRYAITNVREYMEDAILFAIMALMGVDYLVNNLTAFHANLIGLRQLVSLRGGLEALGWPTLLKPGLLSLESFWTYISHQPHLVQQQTVARTMPTAIMEVSATPCLMSPIPSFESMLSKLPAGFRALGEQRRLGEDLLYLIYQIAEFDLPLESAPATFFTHRDGVRKFTHFRTSDGQDVTVASNLHVCEQLARLLSNPELTPLEKVCCIGIFIGRLSSTRTEQLSPIYFTQLQHHAGELLDVPLDDADPAAMNLVAWTIFNVASTMGPVKSSGLPNNYHDDLRLALAVKIVDYFSATRTWEEIQIFLRMFLGSDTCLIAWKNVWILGMEYARNRTLDG